MTSHASDRYTNLIGGFLSGTVDVDSFESSYLDMFKNESCTFSEGVFDILDSLFSDVDAYCSDESLREIGDLDEQQLRECCREALRKLKETLE